MNHNLKNVEIPDNSLAIFVDNQLLDIQKNLRVDKATLLLAQMLVTPGTSGITHFALGSGIGNGTLLNPQKPLKNGSNLFNEQVRVPLTSVQFEDLGNLRGDTVSDGSRSNRVKIVAQIPTSLGSITYTEAGLFGGLNASTSNQGTLFSWVTFPSKNNTVSPQILTFAWVLAFPTLNLEV